MIGKSALERLENARRQRMSINKTKLIPNKGEDINDRWCQIVQRTHHSNANPVLRPGSAAIGNHAKRKDHIDPFPDIEKQLSLLKYQEIDIEKTKNEMILKHQQDKYHRNEETLKTNYEECLELVKKQQEKQIEILLKEHNKQMKLLIQTQNNDISTCHVEAKEKQNALIKSFKEELRQKDKEIEEINKSKRDEIEKKEREYLGNLIKERERIYREAERLFQDEKIGIKEEFLIERNKQVGEIINQLTEEQRKKQHEMNIKMQELINENEEYMENNQIYNKRCEELELELEAERIIIIELQNKVKKQSQIIPEDNKLDNIVRNEGSKNIGDRGNSSISINNNVTTRKRLFIDIGIETDITASSEIIKNKSLNDMYTEEEIFELYLGMSDIFNENMKNIRIKVENILGRQDHIIKDQILQLNNVNKYYEEYKCLIQSFEESLIPLANTNYTKENE